MGVRVRVKGEGLWVEGEGWGWGWGWKKRRKEGRERKQHLPSGLVGSETAESKPGVVPSVFLLLPAFEITQHIEQRTYNNSNNGKRYNVTSTYYRLSSVKMKLVQKNRRYTLQLQNHTQNNTKPSNVISTYYHLSSVKMKLVQKKEDTDYSYNNHTQNDTKRNQNLNFWHSGKWRYIRDHIQNMQENHIEIVVWLCITYTSFIHSNINTTPKPRTKAKHPHRHEKPKYNRQGYTTNNTKNQKSKITTKNIKARPQATQNEPKNQKTNTTNQN
jgi:hypothetical protein